MSGSGKSLIGLWLYRTGNGEEWTLKDGEHEVIFYNNFDKSSL